MKSFKSTLKNKTCVFTICEKQLSNVCIVTGLYLICSFVQLRGDLDDNVDFLINTVINPWMADKDRIHKIGSAFRQTVLNVIGKVSRSLMFKVKIVLLS